MFGIGWRITLVISGVVVAGSALPSVLESRSANAESLDARPIIG
jgi:hypothetical protein